LGSDSQHPGPKGLAVFTGTLWAFGGPSDGNVAQNLAGAWPHKFAADMLDETSEAQLGALIDKLIKDLPA
jgi:hypothetical protein